MTKPCELPREQRAEAKRTLEGYRAYKTLHGQLRKLFDATLGRIDEARATLLTVQTPELRDAIQGSIEAEEAALLKLHGYMLDYRGRMEAIEGAIAGGRLDPVSSELLRLRYLERLPWLEIADRLGYTQDYARGRLHARALEEYAAVTGLV